MHLGDIAELPAVKASSLARKQIEAGTAAHRSSMDGNTTSHQHRLGTFQRVCRDLTCVASTHAPSRTRSSKRVSCSETFRYDAVSKTCPSTRQHLPSMLLPRASMMRAPRCQCTPSLRNRGRPRHLHQTASRGPTSGLLHAGFPPFRSEF